MSRILILLSLLSLAAPAQAETKDKRQKTASELFDKGVAAYQEADYAAAARYYALSIHNRASPEAAANLCNLYLYGQGVEQDYSMALQLCESAAKYNDPHALVMLGEMYYYGNGVPQNREKAMSYYRKGADLDHPHGQLVLGLRLLDSESAEDLEKAIDWFEKAKRNGHPNAETFLKEAQNLVNKKNRPTK
jgi:TPR repeat protein